ncbi:MAG: virulence factor [Actinobacteria bacterium BACL2 MAG-120813-bin23]|jgi:putative peptidoglycan lipid II flippase|uniref:Virulence factor n=4 Tax=ac1 cluster TaxID=1655545 RepID=A0A0R2NYI6_9ACTN|nr:MAG: virulence factor [Actinobacteria bacterium BACL2 MAG-120802-bin41]KRO45149.1 MAG: virulence factor [Actinobacteria bacterium BACL2 MAG-120813-bin23]KRO73942.1 MAG: virulence factor [Actinobacteria bacterium BACL2 MAG-120920-bin34]
MSEDANLIRSSSFMGLGTIISRATGLIRNLLLVAALGTGLLGDAFNVANTTPNIIYNLLIGGALSAVFVPLIVQSFRQEDGGSAYISRLLSLIASALLFITIAAMLLAPLLISLYAPTFSGRSRDVTLAFALYCLPQILFYGLYGILGQVANAKEKFGPMMWAPIANNLLVIVLFSYFISVTDEISLETISDSQIALLGLGSTVGIALQALILIPTLKKSGLKLSFRRDWRGVGLDKAMRLASWAFIFVLVSQIGFLITVNLATRAAVLAQEQGIDYGVGYTPYANAYLVMLLPHSIVTISIVTALLPGLSKLAFDKKLSEVRDQLSKALRLTAILTIPASLFFFFFAEEIASAIFFGISEQSAEYIGRVLAAMSLGLIPLSINLVLIRGLNAFENTKYQVISNLVINLVALTISIWAFLNLDVVDITVGLGVALAISYWVGIVCTYYLLRRYSGPLNITSLLLFHSKVALIALVSCLAISSLLSRLDLEGNLFSLLIVLLSTFALYLAIGRVLKVSEISQVLKVLLRR